MRRILRILTSRLIVIIALIALQIGLILSWVSNVSATHALYPIIESLSIVLAIVVINRDEDPSYKIGWCCLILALPIFGILMYLLCAGRKMPKKLFNGTTHANNRMKNLLRQDPAIMKSLVKKDRGISEIFQYGLNTSRFPVYENTEARTFKSGEEWFPVFKEELKKAEHFIFMEYFIINKGKMWDETLEILKQKVAEGVEVKIIYDDVGCITLPWHYDRTLNKLGIETYKFNKLKPAMVIQMNNRDHRKICVIDNKVGFTGGVNFSDEYINEIVRFGYWRDSAIMIKGDAVWSMTVMFLGMYSYLKKDDDEIDYSRYHLVDEESHGYHGYFQPFSDTPTDDADVGLCMHLNLILHAKNYVYIDTPYLILNDAMKTALRLKALDGVDVRILTPHIPDKRLAFAMTQGNYSELIASGVKIYEYTPGFNHTKNLVADDELAIVGSVNTDYRSYYLHFENGILMYDCPEAVQMRKSFEEALAKSHQVSLEECRRVNIFVRMFRNVANLFAPLF